MDTAECHKESLGEEMGGSWGRIPSLSLLLGLAGVLAQGDAAARLWLKWGKLKGEAGPWHHEFLVPLPGLLGEKC